MNIRTLGLSGFGNNEEQQFRQLFTGAAVPGWTLAAEADADALIIDFDSMGGQMSWLRAQNGARPIVALTAGNRADATHVLQRPVSELALIELLRNLSAEVTGSAVSDESFGLAATESDPLDEANQQTPDARPDEPAESRTLRLIDYLQSGTTSGPALLEPSEPPLVVDVAGDVYYGSASLKSLAALASRPIESDQWKPLDADQLALWQSQLQRQPLARLRWLAGLSAGDGSLLPPLTDSMRFKLNKWPQTEREYPKLFRVATALLKQFATIEELAAASGVSAEEVCDFINACHAIGLIDLEKPAPHPAQAAEGAARGGLLGRFRGKS